jgi:Flp pilus assembly protein TadG
MRAFLNLLLRVARCTSGTAAVEAAIIMPIAIALMTGATDFGRAYTTSSTADKSMRDAARYLAHLPFSAVCSTWAQTNAKNLAVFGNTAGNGNPLITGWSTSNVTVAQPTSCPLTPPSDQVIQVTATVPFTSIMFVGLTSTLNTQHVERWIGG